MNALVGKVLSFVKQFVTENPARVAHWLTTALVAVLALAVGDLDAGQVGLVAAVVNALLGVLVPRWTTPVDGSGTLLHPDKVSLPEGE